MDIVRAHNAVIERLAAEYDVALLPLHAKLGKVIDGRRAQAAFHTDLLSTLRMAVVPVFYYWLGMSWNAIGARNGLHTTADHVHLNERGGRVLQRLAQGFVDDRQGSRRARVAAVGRL